MVAVVAVAARGEIRSVVGVGRSGRVDEWMKGSGMMMVGMGDRGGGGDADGGGWGRRATRRGTQNPAVPGEPLRG